MSHSHLPGRAAIGRSRSLAGIALAYIVAVGAGGLILVAAPSEWGTLWAALAADLVATVVIFGFSLRHGNSSVYDAYWSVAPPLLVTWWALQADQGDALRTGLVLAATWAWGLRLTWNWARGWQGLHEEDWRYSDYRARVGRAYWPLSLAGFHLFPTIQVFLGLTAAHAALTLPAPLGPLDALGAAVLVLAIGLETVADNQLRRFVQSRPPKGSVIETGLWAWCRHPNYLGEVLFWWGLFVLALAAGGTAAAWTAVGALAITAMFRWVSIPMMEKRQVARRPAYAALMDRVPMLLPRPPAADR